ncbi:cytochrome P450 [Streptomyces syringium]|uniref:cytochrome P450 n=1 Tax=Streptomyces syringium TaxID=76729 RepID=UPI003451C86E
MPRALNRASTFIGWFPRRPLEIRLPGPTRGRGARNRGARMPMGRAACFRYPWWRPIRTHALDLDGEANGVTSEYEVGDTMDPRSRTLTPGRTRNTPRHDKATTSAVAWAPGAWPLAGHTVPLMRRPLDFVTSLAAHGDVVRLRLGALPCYALTHPEWVQHVLVGGARDFTRGRLFEKASLFLGEGLVTSSGRIHHRARRAVQPAFHHQRIPAYTAVMGRVAESVVAQWRPGQVVAVDRAMNDLSLGVLANTLLPSGLGSRASAEFHRALPALSRGMMVRLLLPEWWARVPVASNRRFDRARHTMERLVGQAIAAHRDTGGDREDMLSLLLTQRDADGCGLTGRQVHDHVTSLAVAAVETTGATLAWFFHELGRHREIEERVHAEVDTVLGGRPPRFEDLSALAFTGRVVLETLRRYPPWMITRRATAAVRFGTVSVPGGAELLYSPYALHHDPRWFAAPRRFDPDRWLPERARALPRGAFIPFGAGAYKCVGETFALAEMTMAVATVCGRWRLRPLPGARVRVVARANIHPDRLPMVAEAR